MVVVPVVNVDGFDLSRTDGESSTCGSSTVDPLTGDVVLAPRATPTSARTAGSSTARTPPTAAAGRPPPAPAASASASTSTATTAASGAAPVRRARADPAESRPAARPDVPRRLRVLRARDPERPATSSASRQVTMLISNHTFSNLVLRPNGVNPNTIGPDGKPVGDAPDEAGDEGARRAIWPRQNGYANIHGWQLYDTTGTTEDWSYNATGGFGYTFEIGAERVPPAVPRGRRRVPRRRASTPARATARPSCRARGRRRPQATGVLTGRAPKGATLRLTKTFQTPTWEGSFKDGWTPPSGRRGRSFRWHVNPSTRPVVRSTRAYQELAEDADRRQTIEGTTAAPNEHADHEFALTSRRACGAPQPRLADARTTSTSRSTARTAASSPRSAPRATCRARRSRSSSPTPRPATTSCGSSTTPRRQPDLHADRVAVRRDVTQATPGKRRALDAHLREGRQGPPDREGLRRTGRDQAVDLAECAGRRSRDPGPGPATSLETP